MNKRLRKKKHLAEFTEWGCEVAIKLIDGNRFDPFLDDFIAEIEANQCYCGGGGHDDHLGMFIELGLDRDRAEARLGNIVVWLQARSDVATFKLGKVIDSWNGDLEELAIA